MITTTMLGFAEFVTTKDNTVVHFKPSTDPSTTTQPLSQIVRIVVNTVVSSDEKTKEAEEDDRQPIAAAAIAITSTAMFTAQIQSTVQPVSVKSLSQVNDVTPSRNEKKKMEVIGQLPDRKDVTHAPESSFTSDIFTDSGEVNVQIAEHGGHEDVSEHAHVSARAVSISKVVAPSASVTLPTGLVTVLGSTVVQSGQTTVHETRVLGTYIGGTYAQILQSTSKIYNKGGGIVKTSSAASSSTNNRFTLTPSTVEATKTYSTFKRPSYSGIVRSKNVKSSSTAITSSPSAEESNARFSRELSPTPTTKSVSATPTRGRPGRKNNLYSSLAAQRSRIVSNRNSKAQLKTITATSPGEALSSSAFLPSNKDHATVTPSTVINEKEIGRRSTSVSTRNGRTRLTIRAKMSTRGNSVRNTDRNAILKPSRSYSRLTYTPNPSKYYNRRRFRFKTARTSATGEETNVEATDTLVVGESQEARNIEMTSISDIRPSTTLTVTSTFTTELTQYYGPRSEMKSLVFTTTYEQPVVVTRLLDPAAELAARLAWEEDGEQEPIAPTEPLILGVSTSANTQVAEGDDSDNEDEEDSALEDSGENGGEAGYATATPPLNLDLVLNTNTSAIPFMPSVSFSTVSDDFTTTETVLHTSLLPVFDGTSTVVYSMTQQYFITKIVHALKMVPPEELIPFVIPANRKRISNDLNPDLNAAESEHREDSVFPSGNSADDDFLEQLSNKSDILGLLNLTSNDISHRDGENEKPKPDVTTETVLTSIAFPQPSPTPYGQGMNPFFNPFINPLAYLGLGLPFAGNAPGNPNQVITTSRPLYSTETIFGTKVLPIWDGIRTSYHTTKAPSTTIVHTNYETYTTQMGSPAAPGHPYGNNFAQPVQTVTTLTTLVTTETLTSTQVLKLIRDGYKTSYRTLYSTTETVKTLTTQIATTVPYAANPYFG